MFDIIRLYISKGVNMFKWYFSNYFIENETLFYISLFVITLIIVITIYFVYKELKEKNANK